MNSKNNPYDLEKLLALVDKNPGIGRDKAILSFGSSVDHAGRSKMHRAQKKLGSKLFIQKQGGKCNFFTTEYAIENDIPKCIPVEKTVRPTGSNGSNISRLDFDEDVSLYKKINQLMSIGS